MSKKVQYNSQTLYGLHTNKFQQLQSNTLEESLTDVQTQRYICRLY